MKYPKEITLKALINNPPFFKGEVYTFIPSIKWKGAYKIIGGYTDEVDGWNATFIENEDKFVPVKITLRRIMEGY